MSVVEEITALQHALHEQGAQPVVMIDHPIRADGNESEIPVVCNLTASRALVAAALGIGDHRMSAPIFADLTAGHIEPVVVERDAAPVQAIVVEGDQADLFSLPALKQHGGDAAITSLPVMR